MVDTIVERLRGPVFGTQTALAAAAAIEMWKARAERLADMHRDMCVVAGEAVARAETAEAKLSALSAALPAGDGTGMVLVPREPTPEILNAWSYKWGDPNAANCWRDMLNAALSASSGGSGK
jgi:hypothetical protein